MSPTPALKVNLHLMQPRRGCAQTKEPDSDSDGSYRPQSPAYSASSPVYSPTSPAYSDSSNPFSTTSPANSEDSDTDTTASTSLSRYQRPSKRTKVSEPVNWEPAARSVSLESEKTTESTAWPASIRRNRSRVLEVKETPTFSAFQREQALSTGYINNLSVTPAIRRIAQVREDLIKIQDLNNRTKQTVLSIRHQCNQREESINKALENIDLQLEEKKIQTLGKYRELFESPWKLTRQIAEHIHCFDKEGKQICFHSTVQVTSPFKEEPETGVVVQVLENNLVLVRLVSTNKVAGFFGSEILLD